MGKGVLIITGALIGFIIFQVKNAAAKVDNPQALIETVSEVKSRFSQLNDIETSLILGVIQTESNFDSNALGSAGEIGLMQVKPNTYEWMVDTYGIEQISGGIYNAENNITAGALYLAQQIRRTGNLSDGIHAYNRGFGGWESGERNWTYVNKVYTFKEQWENFYNV